MNTLHHDIYNGPDPITADDFKAKLQADKESYLQSQATLLQGIATGLIENPYDSKEQIEWEQRQRNWRLKVLAER